MVHCAFFLSLSLCSKIGEDQSPEDAEDGPPELLVSLVMRLGNVLLPYMGIVLFA